MTEIKSIRRPIEKELNDFEPYFRNALKSDIPLLGTILNYLYRTKGKQIRPMFVFLSAKLHGETNDYSQLAACSVELLHSATLVHDDVVDESYERRGMFSINALWRNKLAVLVGDYILAKGLLLQLEHKKYNFLHLISRAVQQMSEGEILQAKKSRKPDIDESTYFDIIRKKTASLIATSLAIGAASVTDDEEVVEKMFCIGLDAGTAFQIKDDIFDYQSAGFIGKPTGNDIREKKITLPLLHVINQSGSADRRKIMQMVRKKEKSRKEIEALMNLVNENGGIAYAVEKMNEYREKAVRALLEFPESDARNSLIELMNYITTRKK